jgi:hypothetical protein
MFGEPARAGDDKQRERPRDINWQASTDSLTLEADHNTPRCLADKRENKGRAREWIGETGKMDFRRSRLSGLVMRRVVKKSDAFRPI